MPCSYYSLRMTAWLRVHRNLFDAVYNGAARLLQGTTALSMASLGTIAESVSRGHMNVNVLILVVLP